jgi:hypothetical protein
MLTAKYGGKRTFAILALLFPHVDTRNLHHVDHVYPRGLLTPAKLARSEMSPDEVKECMRVRDLLPNLQLLEGPENIGKKDKQPAVWAQQTFEGETRTNYLDRNALPVLPSTPAEFLEWYAARRDRLRGRLLATLGLATADS